MDWPLTVATALLAALVLGTLARRLGLSPLLGYLLAGVAIGPHTPGFVGDSRLAGQLADVGVVLLMFGVGLGFSFEHLWAVRRIAGPGAVAASGAVLLLGASIGTALGWPIGSAAVLGMCLATASTVVIVRGMTELGLLAAAPGRIAVGWSLVEDLITVLLLVLLPSLAPVTASDAIPLWQALLLSLGKIGLLAALVVFCGGLIVPRLLAVVARAQSRELFTLAVLTFALSVAWLAAEVFGVSLALGAFFAGMVVGRSDLAHQAAADALPMRDAFAVLFFVAVGMLFDPLFVWHHPLPVLAALAVVLVLKPAVGVVLMLSRGLPIQTALSVGAGIAQISEFSFVLATLATDLDILPEGGRDLVIAAALASVATSPLLFAGVQPLSRWLAVRPAVSRFLARRTRHLAVLSHSSASDLERHIVMCGFGRVGSVLAAFLNARGVPFVAIEIDRAVVERLRAEGVAALYGDAGSPVLLDQAGIERAAALVLTVPDAVTQRLAIEHARALRPDIEVVVRVHSESDLRRLTGAPRTRPVHGERELGFAMARQLLEVLGASAVEAEAAVMGAAHGGHEAPRMFEIVVPAGAPFVGKTLAEIGLPNSALVVAVVRRRRHLVARGPTRLEAGDVLLLFASSDDAQAVERQIAATAPREGSTGSGTKSP